MTEASAQLSTAAEQRLLLEEPHPLLPGSVRDTWIRYTPDHPIREGDLVAVLRRDWTPDLLCFSRGELRNARSQAVRTAQPLGVVTFNGRVVRSA